MPAPGDFGVLPPNYGQPINPAGVGLFANQCAFAHDRAAGASFAGFDPGQKNRPTRDGAGTFGAKECDLTQSALAAVIDSRNARDRALAVGGGVDEFDRSGLFREKQHRRSGKHRHRPRLIERSQHLDLELVLHLRSGGLGAIPGGGAAAACGEQGERR